MMTSRSDRRHDPRWQRHCIQIHALGPRPLAEVLVAIAAATGQPDIVTEIVEAYATRLDPEIVRAVGGDRFPSIPLMAVLR